MDKLKIDKLIIVEGKYDKIRLENIVDADVFAVNGFSVFNDPAVKSTLKSLSRDKGVIILTDSDTAGYKIRVYLTKLLCNADITNVFLPQIHGKEKRKASLSAEGYLGVEGIDNELILTKLKQYSSQSTMRNEIDIAMLYDLGYVGRPGSKTKRNELLRFMGVQSNISNKFLLRLINEKYTLKQFIELDINNRKEGK